MPGRRPLVGQRALDLEPPVGDARLAVPPGERVLEPGLAGPGAEQAGRVGADRLARHEVGFELVGARLDPGVERADPPELVRRGLGVDGDRLGAMARRHVVEIGDEPLLRPAVRLVGTVRAGARAPPLGADPHGLGVESHLVPARRARPELAELRLDRLVGTGDDPDALLIAACGVRGAGRQRLLARADVGLGRRAQDGEGGPLGRRVEHAVLELPGEARLVAGVIADRRRRRAVRPGGHRLPERVVGREEVTRHLHVRDVERGAHLVRPMRDPVLGEHLLDLDPGRGEQVAEGVLVFVAVEPTAGRPTLPRDAVAGQGPERRGELLRERLDLPSNRPRPLPRGHLAAAHPVEHPAPRSHGSGRRRARTRAHRGRGPPPCSRRRGRRRNDRRGTPSPGARVRRPRAAPGRRPGRVRRGTRRPAGGLRSGPFPLALRRATSNRPGAPRPYSKEEDDCAPEISKFPTISTRRRGAPDAPSRASARPMQISRRRLGDRTGSGTRSPWWRIPRRPAAVEFRRCGRAGGCSRARSAWR